jgi:hypothetical protein
MSPSATTSRPPFSVVAALHDIVAHADPALPVQAAADPARIRIHVDRLQFRVQAPVDGHLYVYLADTTKSHFYLLFPNQIDGNNRITAGRELVLPRQGWNITAEGPPGTHHIVAMVSPMARDFAQTGLRQGDAGMPEFELGAAQRRWNTWSATGSPFVGRAKCPASGRCDEGYGAAMFEIEEVSGR